MESTPPDDVLPDDLLPGADEAGWTREELEARIKASVEAQGLTYQDNRPGAVRELERRAKAKAAAKAAAGGDQTALLILGTRVKALREAGNMSLRDLAERCGVSAPMLSQVERGETSPTLQVAAKIAAGLDLRLSQLLRLDESGAVSVVRAGERRNGPATGTGHTYEILTPPLPGQRAELSVHHLAAGAATGGPGDPPMHEPGSRETALVQAGTVVLACDDTEYELGVGDAVTFDADLPHHFENRGNDEATLTVVVSAGLRRS